MKLPSILCILYPGCIFFELALVLELLSKKYQVVFTTPDGSDHEASNGAIVRVDTPYNHIDLSSCRAILVPGGDPKSIMENVVIDEVIREGNTRGVWLAAICAGPLVLAKANILKGKKIAHGYEQNQLEYLKSYFDGVFLSDEKFVCDGNVITAKPDAHICFAVEVACRLGVIDASKANRTKEYYRGLLGRSIRPLALALIRNSENQFLFHRGFDTAKRETFYRPLGGGIEFSELGQDTVKREIMEELNQVVSVSELIVSFESIFTFEDIKGHEIILLFSAKFKNKNVYQQQELDVFESGVAIAKAVWRSVAEIKAEGANLFPTGLEEVINSQ